MKQTFLFIFIFFVSIQHNFSQKLVLSDQSEISIITAGPGDVLYEAFGHSAIRVKDPTLNLDIIFNYGLFDFNQPNFYVNFVKGRLLYRLGKQSFRRFITSYDYQQRWVKNQVLNLSLVDRVKIFENAIIGVNNRNLKTFEVDIQNSINLKQEFDGKNIFVSESGIKNSSDIEMLKSNGINVYLIDESLMRGKLL